MIEYSGLKFGMFYVADFLHAFTVSLLFATFFLGGYRGPWSEAIPLLGLVYYLIKTFAVWFFILLLRGSLPRFRIDQMMDLNWKFLTPLSLVALVVSAVAYKLVPAGNIVLQVVVMLAVNALLIGGAELFSRQTAKQHPRPVVVTTPRPVAIYKRPSKSEPGAE
jgi:NADH-quinone oxidoreductase subunit H